MVVMMVMMMVMSRKLRVHLWCFVHLSYLLYTLTDACPGRLTCALLRREPCPAGSRACGPCRALHTLGAQGHCVSDDRRHRLGLPGDDADEEFIASVLSGAHTTTTTATSGGDGGGDGHGDGGDGDGGGGALEPRGGEQRRGGKAHGQQWQHLRGASPPAVAGPAVAGPGAAGPGASGPGVAVSATAWRGQEEQQEEEETRRGTSRAREGDDTKEDPGRAGDTRESRRHRAGRRGKGAHGEVAMSGGGDRSDDLEPEISKPLGTVAGRLAASKSASAPSPLLLVAAMVSTVAAVSALVTMAACWYRLHRAGGMVQKADYRVCSAHSPGSQRPPTLPRADSRLAHRAQLYHYQQKRQQLMAMDRETEESQTPNSLTDSENEEGDITVYECPGLAPTGEMEVNNPLFDEMRANSPSHTPGR
ncbi:neural proliferation differentiation and control protein 1 [Lampetra planeri]